MTFRCQTLIGQHWGGHANLIDEKIPVAFPVR